MSDTSPLAKALSDRYVIERELGQGGMATVYLAEDLKHHRKVAVKVLRPELAQALGADRFHQEIEIAAKLTHPHILPLHDSGDADGFLYYVMPYIEGQSLRDKLAAEGELPIADAVRIIKEIVDALSHAHKHNVVHRDIKPDNVMLAERHALVADFGVAKAVSEATGAHKLTTEGVALGTPTYMAPEQAAADPHIDHRADIYAVGVIAYELLTGRTPFVGNTQQELLAAHVTQTPEPVTKYRESVPPALAELVMRCLEKKAADRWQTAEELLPQLEAVATPSGGVTPSGIVPMGAARRGWRLAAVAGAIAVLLAVVLVVTLVPRGGTVALDPERVLVAVFDNQTGDPSLDPLGVMVGNWITQGLQKSGVVQVVPWLEAQQASRYVASEIGAGNVRSPVTALAEETGAGTVISGAYYQRGETVQYQVEVTDVIRGHSLSALDPVIAPVASPDDAVDPIRQRVMGFLAVNYDERIDSHVSSAVQPPSFEAYQAFSDGLERYYLRDWPGAIPHLYRAFELDTTFASPLIYAALNHLNLNQWAQADSLLVIVERNRDRLSDYDRHWLDHLNAWVSGDYLAALRSIRRAAELAPGSKAVFNTAITLQQALNRPQEAVDVLRRLDPDRGPMRGWRGYHQVLRNAYSTLGEHAKALETARRYREIFGDHPTVTLWHEGMSLAALGRVAELNTLIDEQASLAGPDLSHGDFLSTMAGNLRRHGHLDAARATINRAIEWYEARSPETKTGVEWRSRYASALYIADRCEEAYAVAKPLSEEFPEEIDRRGFTGVLAACNGDQEEALQVSRWLAELDTPYLRGYHTSWRSRIAGALGDGEAAVSLTQQALAEGAYPPHVFHHLIEFEPVRDYPPFQEAMRPKG